ncbi:MAG TPA: hypothetical protein PK765_01585 [bacterium]|nr:hypothetical protein [bacterium]
MFSTGSLFPRFLYRYSNVATFDIFSEQSDNIVIRFLKDSVQEVIDFITQPVNDVFAIFASLGPIADDSEVCFMGIRHTVEYQFALSYTGTSVLDQLRPYQIKS